MLKEQEKLKDNRWKKWGPYVSDRQWGTVREDYSATGDAWNFTTHDMARSKAWRWGEEGIGGICDEDQLLCFAVGLWNKQDPFIKERFFGLTNAEGNHGEDVKELYYYLENTPSHSYMKMLYKYPQQPFPYQLLLQENKRRTKEDQEFEILDTGIFNEDEYFDVFIEYAKQSEDDILIKITACNRGLAPAPLVILPTVWFRNTWAWGYDNYKPGISVGDGNSLAIHHETLGPYYLFSENNDAKVFCENETNTARLYNYANENTQYYKDGINNYIVSGENTVNTANTGTKATFNIEVNIAAGEETVIRLSLTKNKLYFFDSFEKIFADRKSDADDFYKEVLKNEINPELLEIKRQAFAGLLWNKQFYYFNVSQWLNGDPALPAPPPQRKNIRNESWKNINNREILSVPDKWEFPWFASWDTAFHCLSFALIDPAFAKSHLLLLTKDWYMHPNGQIPACEWNFSDCNPPLHAMAAWEIYSTEKAAKDGKGDRVFLETIFHKLMLNFTWWVNRKDARGNNVFEGGFLGLDNIGVFDRSNPLPIGGYLEQADATSWMAMYCLNLLRIANELSFYNSVYSDISAKFFEHFLYIAGTMNGPGENLWDDSDNFYYDRVRFPDQSSVALKVRSLVGLIPLLVVETINDDEIQPNSTFTQRMEWFKQNRPDLANLVSHWEKKNNEGVMLVSLMRGHRMKMVLKYLLDENEFLSEYGIRSLSKFHQHQQYQLQLGEESYNVAYSPGESTSGMFGGNSNWRGPLWLPMNALIIKSLRNFYKYYGDGFKAECPTGSGNWLTLNEIADELTHRINKIFITNAEGKRPVYGDSDKQQHDPYFKNYILFCEYFNGDNGKGLGASHQTGWTAMITSLL